MNWNRKQCLLQMDPTDESSSLVDLNGIADEPNQEQELKLTFERLLYKMRLSCPTYLSLWFSYYRVLYNITACFFCRLTLSCLLLLFSFNRTRPNSLQHRTIVFGPLSASDQSLSDCWVYLSPSRSRNNELPSFLILPTSLSTESQDAACFWTL